MKNFNSINKYIILMIMIFTLGSIYGQNSDEARKLLNDVSETMNSYTDIYISFDYIFENKDGGVSEEKSEGDAVLKGEKYVVNIFGITRIYDGSKTYTIIHENEEVNIAENDEDESVLLTPSALFNFHKSGYSYQLGEKQTINEMKIQFVHLIPIDSQAEIAMVKIGVDTKSKHIESVKHVGKNNSETTIMIKEIDFNKGLAETLFQFDEKKYEDKNYIINR